MTLEQKNKALSLLAQGAHINPNKFSPYLPLAGYNMDSLDIVGSIAAIEEEFDIKVPDSELPKFKCGNDVLAYLESVI